MDWRYAKENLKSHLLMAAVVCFVGAGIFFRSAVERETNKNLVTEVPLGEGAPLAQISVNTEKLCYFELSLTIYLTAAPSGVVGDSTASDSALANPQGRIVPVKYTVLDRYGREIFSDTADYLVSEFNLESPVSATLRARETPRLGRFVKIEPPGDISVQTSIIEGDALSGFHLQSTYGGVSVWDNALPRAGGLKISAMVLISIGLLAMVWFVTELLKDFFP